MLCPNCKKEIADGAQFCPECGANLSQQVNPAPVNTPPEKQKKPVTKKWWFWVLIVIAAFILIGMFSGGSDDTDSDTPANNDSVVQADETTTEKTIIETTTPETTTEETTKVTTTEKPALSESEYKASCSSITYKDIARQPDSYKGQNIMFTGEVMQVSESSYSNKVVLLIQVTKDQYGYWDDLVYVTYTLPEGAPRILEDDIVKFYGECKGTYTYETVMGSNNTIPSVSALYIDIQ